MEAFRYWLLKTLLPLTKALGSLHFPWTKKKLRGEHWNAIADVIKPGDVLLSRISGEPSNLVNPGYWKHAAIYFGGPNQTVIEAVGEGVRKITLAEFVLTKDAVAVCRANFMTTQEAQYASSMAMLAVGEPYDFFFMPNNQAWYCSELVYEVIKRTVPIDLPFTRRKTLGVFTVIPTDFWRARKKFDIVWSSIAWGKYL